MKCSKRVLSIFLCVILWTQLCGASFLPKKAVIMDTEKNRVYKYVTVDTIEKAFEKDKKSAKEDYDDGYYLLSGKIKEISKNGDRVVIGSGNREIECSCEKSIRENVLKYKVDNEVALYGKISLGTFDKERHLKAQKIINSPEKVKSDETYYMLNGKSFDVLGATARTLGNGRVKYRIPSSWKDIELKIEDNDLGSIDGYQYVLSNEPNKQEYLFVAYFDKNKLRDKAEIKKSELVEKAIIENIEGAVGKFPVRKQKTYYGAQYKYYIGDYTYSAWGKGYRTEYIFQEDGENGIALLLYVYTDSKHLTDVILTSRFLEITK